MSTWYRTDKHDIRIYPIEVVKSTSARVWVLETDRMGRPSQSMIAKHTEYHQVHETFEAARKFLFKRESDRCDYHKRQYDAHQDKMNKVFTMKPIDATPTDSTTEQSTITEVTAK